MVYTANHDCLRLLLRVCHCWQMFFLLGFPFGREYYVIALNPDLLYCISIFDLFPLLEERSLLGILAAVVICYKSLVTNLLQIAGICKCLNLHIIELVSSLCAVHEEGKLCDS